MKALIIDDEAPCRKALSWDLNKYHPEIEVIGMAQNGLEGLELINELKPDLVFLDVEMPVLNGVQMIKRLDIHKPQIIFTTAYDQFAIQAFRLNALDFLLKPIDREELKDALEKSKQSQSEDHTPRLEELVRAMDGQRLKVASFPVFDGIEFVEIVDVMYCRADSNYTEVVLKDGSKLIVSKTLKQIEAMLEFPEFLRIHKSSLINLRFLKKYLRGNGGYAQMKDGEELPVARSRKEVLLSAFKK